MKNILKNPVVKKILIVLVAIIVFILLLDNLILPWYVSSPEAQVPDVVGMQEDKAFARLEEFDLEPVISDTTFDEEIPRGSVIFQNPEAGETVKEGRRIYLFVSGGEPVVYTPNLKGKSIRDAKFSLERLGLKLGEVEEVESDNPKDMIFDQQYAPGTPLNKGETVDVTVSEGSRFGEITVPDVIGKSLTEARILLADSSLKVGKINYQRSFSLLPNTILDQYPSKGSKVNKGTSVDLFVTKAAEAGDREDDIIEE